MHLGTWIAGKIPTGDSLGLRGTASYTGHSIGNVFNNGSLYTAVGSFKNHWNFDKRTGTVQMNFDKTNYTGTTAIKGSSFNFDGNLTAPGRQGGLQGSFVAPVNPTPAAVMGGLRSPRPRVPPPTEPQEHSALRGSEDRSTLGDVRPTRSLANS